MRDSIAMASNPVVPLTFLASCQASKMLWLSARKRPRAGNLYGELSEVFRTHFGVSDRGRENRRSEQHSRQPRARTIEASRITHQFLVFVIRCGDDDAMPVVIGSAAHLHLVKPVLR